MNVLVLYCSLGVTTKMGYSCSEWARPISKELFFLRDDGRPASMGASLYNLAQQLFG